MTTDCIPVLIPPRSDSYSSVYDVGLDWQQAVLFFAQRGLDDDVLRKCIEFEIFSGKQRGFFFRGIDVSGEQIVFYTSSLGYYAMRDHINELGVVITEYHSDGITVFDPKRAK